MQIRAFSIRGFWWLGVARKNDAIYLIRKVGRVGDCVRF